MDDKRIIDKIKRIIHENDPGADAFLFGSRARGDNRDDSDWDIIIIVDSLKVTNEVDDKFRDKLYDIEVETGQVISTFVYTRDSWENSLKWSPLYKNVCREGVRL